MKEVKPSRSILDPHIEKIDQLIAKDSELSAIRVLEKIEKEGYGGEVTLVRNYLRKIRPARGRIYQEVEYRPGEAMQVDWGDGGANNPNRWSWLRHDGVVTSLFRRVSAIPLVHPRGRGAGG